MAGLDTNVLLRWLVRDDASQTTKVDVLIENARTHQESYFIPITVVLELEWVLRSRYRYSKNTFATTLKGMLETRELEFQSAATLEQALQSLDEYNTDFADCVHSELCTTERRAPLLTFDSRAARLPETRLLEG